MVSSSFLTDPEPVGGSEYHWGKRQDHIGLHDATSTSRPYRRVAARDDAVYHHVDGCNARQPITCLISPNVTRRSGPRPR